MYNTNQRFDIISTKRDAIQKQQTNKALLESDVSPSCAVLNTLKRHN